MKNRKEVKKISICVNKIIIESIFNINIENTIR